MDVKVGVDIAPIDRVARWIECYSDEVLSLVFTQKEMDASRRNAQPARYLTTCFAGKEAVAKALGTGLVDIGWNEIEINVREGSLTVYLSGEAQRIAQAGKLTGWSGSFACSGLQVIVFIISQTEEVCR